MQVCGDTLDSVAVLREHCEKCVGQQGYKLTRQSGTARLRRRFSCNNCHKTFGSRKSFTKVLHITSANLGEL